jgi:NADP-dependent 3-hydroxy acid dehydrogenase YdfG
MKIALITGATSGIGEAIALKFAQKDINVIS